MSSTAKFESVRDGKKFLLNAFEAEQKVLQTQLSLSQSSITHDGVMGEVNEQLFIDVIRRYLPDRYAVSRGIVIDGEGHTSDQIDCIVYDRQYTPVLLDQKGHLYVPAEAVYSVIECKPTINKTYLEYAGRKANSVRNLKRTSVPIPHAGGTYPAKPHFGIVAGIVAVEVEWKDGLGTSLESAISSLETTHQIDFSLSASGAYSDTFNGDGARVAGPSGTALMFFLFRFLEKLQSLSTVPAVDWNAYAENAKT